MKTYLLFFVIFYYFLLSCSSNTESEKLENKLYISITDSNDVKLEGVGLHFFYDLGWGNKIIKHVENNHTLSKITEFELYQNFPNPFNPMTSIQFSLSTSNFVTLEIVNRIDSTVISTLINSELAPGMYQVNWDGTNNYGEYVTNNIYNYILSTHDSSASKNLFINMADPEHIKSLNCIPLAVSNNEGEMQISYDIFPINIDTKQTDEVGNELGILTINNTITLIFIKDGFKPLKSEVTIINNQPIDIKITLEQN